MKILSQATDWNIEYQDKGIPSSFRSKPSEAIGIFLSLISNIQFSGKMAVDIGCGAGRNSMALSQAGYQVISLDFSSEAIKQFKKKLSGMEPRPEIEVHCHNVTHPWPTPDGWADIAIDTFCFKHQVPEGDKQAYIEQLRRTLRPGGLFLLTLADVEDGYYKQFFHPEIGKNVIIDPANKIPSVLYTKEDIQKLFKGFEIIEHQKENKTSLMHGVTYHRVTHLFVFKRFE